MASLLVSFAPSTTRVLAVTAAKGTAGGKQRRERAFRLDSNLGNLQKEDQFYESDPLLNKVDEKNGDGGGGGGGGCGSCGCRNSVSVPQKKKGGGFGGLFAKK